LHSALTDADLLRSPAWLPLRLDATGAMTLVCLSEPQYAAASFLDDRILAAGAATGGCALHTLRSAAMQLAPSAHYVFHIGHVGSTLLSRLLGAHPCFFSLREPALLRTFADATAAAPGSPQPALTLGEAIGLLSRTWRHEQTAVVKTTSFVNQLACSLLELSENSRALFMYVEPANYLRGIFGGANSRLESKAMAPARLARLQHGLGGALQSTASSEGEWIALNWLSEMSSLHRAAALFGARVTWLNFDAFLHRPRAGLAAAFRALGANVAAQELDSLLASPLMRQYSKAPEHAYDAALRADVLRAADWEHGAEIRRGMQWLDGVAARHPAAKAVLESAFR
jgi:hypothetical protein